MVISDTEYRTIDQGLSDLGLRVPRTKVKQEKWSPPPAAVTNEVCCLRVALSRLDPTVNRLISRDGADDQEVMDLGLAEIFFKASL